MRYGTVPGVPNPVSRLFFGTASPIINDAARSEFGDAPDFDARLARAFELLDAVWALGITAFDCAAKYGEEALGEWLSARGLHGKAVLLTKGAHFNAFRNRVTPYDILSDAHDSLCKLRTDCIDIYLLHRDDPSVPVGPVMEALDSLCQQGRLRVIGTSNWTCERIDEANDYALAHRLTPFTVGSPNFGLAEQVSDLWGGGCVSLSGPEAAAARQWYLQRKMPVVAYSSLGRGFFGGRLKSDHPEKTGEILDEFAVRGYVCPQNFERLRRAEALSAQKGCTVPQLALSWLLHQKLDVYAAVHSNAPERMAQNTAALDVALTPQECAWLNLEQDCGEILP